MGCVSGRQRQRAKVVSNFPAFDEEKQREFETVFFSQMRELQTKIGVVEAIRQEWLLLSDVEEADQDKVKLEETINKLNAAWSETRVMYKDVVDRVDFSIHEYSTESLDQNKLQKILIDIGERPTTENRNLASIKKLLEKQAEYYGEEGQDPSLEQRMYSREEYEHKRHSTSLEDGILGLGEVVAHVGDIAHIPVGKESPGGFCQGGRRSSAKKMRGYIKNSKDFDPDKQEAFDMTVMRTYDELDSEKMILDALYEDYAILKTEFKPISALESKEREIHKYRKQVGDLLLKISNELQYVENKDFINASYSQLDQKKLNLLFFRLNIKPTKKSRTLSFLSNAYKEVGERHIDAENEFGGAMDQSAKVFESLFDDDGEAEQRAGCF